jgi:hypothetical protein
MEDNTRNYDRNNKAMNKVIVRNGDTIERSEVGSVSEPQHNRSNAIPNASMTLAIKVERATDLYVSSRRGMIKSRLICADILINDSDTPEFVDLVKDRNPAGEHAATKIISLCSGKNGIGGTRRLINARFLEWVRNLSGGDDATSENFANPTWVEAMVDHVIAQRGLDECAQKYADWKHKVPGHLGYEPPPAPGNKPKDKGGRPRSRRADKSVSALAEEAGVVIHPEDLATLEEPEEGEAGVSGTPEPEDEVPLDDLVAELRATLKPYRTFTAQNAGAPRPPKLGVCIVLWDEFADKWFVYGASTDEALIRSTLRSL